MRTAEAQLTALYMVVLSMSGMLVPYIEPQLAGLWGGCLYLIVRHESKTGTFTFPSLLMVLAMGYLGAWAIVHTVPVVYNDMHDSFVQILAFSAGFMTYDFFMAWGNNSKSVMGLILRIVKEVISKVVFKWTP